MFRKGYDFIKKHKKKAVLAGAVYGGLYAYNNSDVVRIVVDHGWNWMWNKVTDFVPALSSADNPNDSHGQYSRSQNSHFGTSSSRIPSDNDACGEIANDESIVATALQLLEESIKVMDDLLNTDALRQKISQNPANKMELWEEMKIVAWSRCFVAIYTVCHLVVYIKVQTGVSGRFLYLQDAETEEQLHWKLSLISRHMQCTDYPIREGLIHLIKIVKSVVAKPVAPRALQDGLCLTDIKQIVYEIRKLMEAGSNVNGFVHPRNYHLEFVIPADQLDHSVEREPITHSSDDRTLLALIEDANRALESVDCNMVLNCCLERCFSRLFSEVDCLIKERNCSNGDTPSAAARIPHVALLPALDRMSNLFAKPLDAQPLVKDLAALSYFRPFVDSIVRQSLQRDSLAPGQDQ